MFQASHQNLYLLVKWFVCLSIAWSKPFYPFRWIGMALLVATGLTILFSFLTAFSATYQESHVQMRTRHQYSSTPYVISTAPAVGETYVSVVQPLRIIFTHQMDPSTFNDANVIVQPVGYNERVAGNVTYENDSVTWIPTQYWRPFTAYQITLTAGIRDITGSSLLPYTWIFTTHFDSNLPIVVVDTLGMAIQDEPKIPARMQIIRDPYFSRNALHYLSIQTESLHFNGQIGIEVRGNTSQAYPKKQYGLETWDADNHDLDVSLLSLPAESDWILQGPYIDRTLLRNFLAYDLSNRIGRYAARSYFVELFLNNTASPDIGPNQYVGVYLLMEKIKRNKNRVNVAKLTAEHTLEPEISGGYIIKQDVTDPGDLFFYTAIGNHQITYVYPDGDQVTEAQNAWLENYFHEFETSLVSDHFMNYNNGYAQYIDVNAFVDHLLLNEFLRNVDALRISAYLHKDRQGKLAAGPIWDFDFSAGNMDLAGAWNFQGWQSHNPTGGPYPIPFWWTRLLEDNCFVQRLTQRWSELRRGPFNTATVNNIIDNTAHSLDEAQIRNFQRWNILGRKIYLEEFVGDTYTEEIDYMKAWLAHRAEWMDKNIKSISTRESSQSPGICIAPINKAYVSAEGYTTTLMIGLSSRPMANVSIHITGSDNQLVNFAPDRIDFVPSAWDMPQTVTVTISDTDSINERAVMTYTAALDLANSADTTYAILDTTIITPEAMVIYIPKLDHVLYLPVVFE